MNKINMNVRKMVLERIKDEFVQVRQWTSGFFSGAMVHEAKAVALIELLEEDDCGSTGGYDPNNPKEEITGYHEFDRFLTLLKKYDTVLSDDDDVAMEELQKFFTGLSAKFGH